MKELFALVPLNKHFAYSLMAPFDLLRTCDIQYLCQDVILFNMRLLAEHKVPLDGNERAKTDMLKYLLKNRHFDDLSLSQLVHPFRLHGGTSVDAETIRQLAKDHPDFIFTRQALNELHAGKHEESPPVAHRSRFSRIRAFFHRG
jgi:hypothetical protein